MTTLDKEYIKNKDYGHLSLDQRIIVAAEKIFNGELVSFRGASADTYVKVMSLVNRMEQERDFPWCPCEECE